MPTAGPGTWPEPSARYHSLDALRATMMLLGIYLHAAIAYSRHGAWPWKDGSTTTLFDASLGLIHVFRMPCFYLLGGFFAALLLERSGAAHFIRNRTARILVPFVAAWAVLFPLVIALAAASAGAREPAELLGAVFSQHPDPMHLWFLEYLLVFYVIALAAAPLLRRAPRLVARVERGFRAGVVSPVGPSVFAAVTLPTLCLMQDGPVDDPSGFAPQGRILLAYLVFFGTGWLLHRNADLLAALRRRSRVVAFLALGLVAAMLGGYSIWHRWHWPEDHAFLWFLAGSGFVSLAMWHLTLGLTGAFLRWLARPRPWIRYLSDSSYWLYLVHMPILLVFQLAVSATPWPPAIKALIVLAAAVPTLLASYHLLVRSTWIGALLNGRKHGRLADSLGTGHVERVIDQPLHAVDEAYRVR